MDRKTSSSKPKISGKRVGASVIVDGQTPIGVNPYPPVTATPFTPGFPYPPVPGIGIPNPCGPCCPPPFFPPLPFPPFPGFIIDDRIDPIPDDIDVSITAGVAPQTISPNSTAALVLTSALVATNGARVSGSSITLPVEGTYTLSINITASRAPGSTGGFVSFILNGGVSGSGNIAFGDLAMSSTQVFSGSVTLRTNSPNTPVSILVNNAGGILQILGGTVTAQLTSLVNPIF